MATTKRGEVQALQTSVRRVIAERQASVRVLSGLPPAAPRSSGKRTVPTR